MTIHEPAFPFARELREQHDALRAVVRWFLAEAGRKPGGPAQHARGLELLRLFRDELHHHFRFEEQGAFQDGMSSRDRSIRGWTQELVRQHRDFEARLDALLGDLERSPAAGGVPAALLAKLANLLGALRRHDAEENALLRWVAGGS